MSKYTAKAFGNPPEFRATGRGEAVRLPDFPATETNANALFINKGVPLRDAFRKIYLFITEVETGWNVQGNYGQSQNARTWYPLHLQQDALTIRGCVANQYEYDRLVEFVRAHQKRAVNQRATDAYLSNALRFQLFGDRVTDHRDKKGEPVYRNLHYPMEYDGYIQKIQAGHQRFRYAIEWEMQLLIAFDYLGDRYTQPGLKDQFLKQNYLKMYGGGAGFYKAPKGSNASAGNNPAPTDNAGTFTDAELAELGQVWHVLTSGELG